MEAEELCSLGITPRANRSHSHVLLWWWFGSMNRLSFTVQALLVISNQPAPGECCLLSGN